jgi:twitching motility protein PilI
VTRNIFAEIKSAARRFDEASAGLPAQKQIVELRKLVGFSVLGENYVIPLNELSEVLEVPKCIKLPRVKSWVCGLSNVRGRLLPIIDVADFFGGTLTGPLRERRVLVLDRSGIYVGLIVDAVYGIKSLALSGYRETQHNGPLAPFVEGSFSEENRELPLFCVQKLIEDGQFLSVSV